MPTSIWRTKMSVKRIAHHRTFRRARRAFTLLEVIVVVTIIALLAALVAPRLLGRVGQAKQNIAMAEVSEIAKLVNLYLLDNDLSRVPDDFDLDLLAEGEDPYLAAKELFDPWDNPYIIRTGIDAENPDFDIVSYGADGQPGGEGDEADIVN